MSRDHEIHAELFRNRPELARVLLHMCASIDLPGLSLTPIVISYDDLPRITDRAAIVVPELAVLSARAHPDLDVARVATDAIRTLSEDQQTLYWSFLTTLLPDPVCQALEAEMPPAQMREAIAEMTFERGVKRGLVQGLEQGRADALRAVAVNLAKAKLGPRCDAALETRLEGLPPTVLDELIASMIATDDPHEILAAIERVRGS
ncbi:MAG: hypothetical protein M3619_24905 [Myxococcota bacterium]|nr:hypothetical protein [Myxococcota bacterium]